MRRFKLTELDPHWVTNVGQSGGNGISFECPEADGGCGGRHVIPFDIWTPTTNGGATFETLTLTPSIRCSGACQWHGFIKNGKIEFCADSKSGPDWDETPTKPE